MHLNPTKSLEKLAAIDEKFLPPFCHGSMSAEVYKPEKVDLQQPHEQDEIYVVIAGTDIFFNNGKRTEFAPGDLLFVAADKEHRFENFTDDFSAWVIFYGSKGGENKD
ncbi:MAG: mannose-6-phosphate isomerase-like protein (cupin superfamily) [Paraglaciecola sp.]|jgi:mannose-6-phosphate isomerase-like protein (cupin superfamily)